MNEIVPPSGTKFTVEPCKKCRLPHSSKFGPKRYTLDGACSICDRPRETAGRYCRACRAQYWRGHRPKGFEIPAEKRFKSRSRAYTGVLVSRGKIAKRVCENCGSEESEAHHLDYRRPRLVVWLCRECHMDRHDSGGYSTPVNLKFEAEEQTIVDSPCEKCGLLHGGPGSRKHYKLTRQCTLCDEPRAISGGYCKSHRAIYVRGHRRPARSWVVQFDPCGCSDEFKALKSVLKACKHGNPRAFLRNVLIRQTDAQVTFRRI